MIASRRIAEAALSKVTDHALIFGPIFGCRANKITPCPSAAEQGVLIPDMDEAACLQLRNTSRDRWDQRRRSSTRNLRTLRSHKSPVALDNDDGAVKA